MVRMGSPSRIDGLMSKLWPSNAARLAFMA